MSHLFNHDWFRQLPIVGILRSFKLADIERLVPASISGGLRNIEITMNSAGAEELISRTCALVGEQANVGAGTVTSISLLERALTAGASFIVTPTLVPDVIQVCVRRGIPVMPGAFTPTEIAEAWELGATMVKVFPAEALGPGYIKAVKAPLPHIPLMPTGGVSVDTLQDFKRAGADAFGVGSPLFDPKQVATGNWDWFRVQAERFAEAYRQA